jgi:hypothetical protein
MLPAYSPDPGVHIRNLKFEPQRIGVYVYPHPRLFATILDDRLGCLSQETNDLPFIERLISPYTLGLSIVIGHG